MQYYFTTHFVSRARTFQGYGSEYHMRIHFHVDKTHAFCAQWHDGWVSKIW